MTTVIERLSEPQRLAEPHEWFAYYDARREEEYQALIRGKTCLDCGRCRKCKKHPDTGFCMEDGDFVYDDEYVKDIGCECFEAA